MTPYAELVKRLRAHRREAEDMARCFIDSVERREKQPTWADPSLEKEALAGEVERATHYGALAADLRVAADALEAAGGRIAALEQEVALIEARAITAEARAERLEGLLRRAWGLLEPECGTSACGECGPRCELRSHIDAALAERQPEPREGA